MMGFRENLLKKIEIMRLADTVVRSINPTDGTKRIDLDTMRQLLDLSSYVSVSQAAKELSVHPETARRLLRQDILTGGKAGTLWFIAKEELRRFKATYDPRTGPRKRAGKNGGKD